MSTDNDMTTTQNPDTLADFIDAPGVTEATARFKTLICDLVDEGVEPDAITQALARLGFGFGP